MFYNRGEEVTTYPEDKLWRLDRFFQSCLLYRGKEYSNGLRDRWVVRWCYINYSLMTDGALPPCCHPSRLFRDESTSKCSFFSVIYLFVLLCSSLIQKTSFVLSHYTDTSNHRVNPLRTGSSPVNRLCVYYSSKNYFSYQILIFDTFIPLNLDFR